MKKSLLLLLALLLSGAANAQTIFFDGFEEGFTQGWTFFNDDNTPPSYYHNWDTTAWGIYSGSGNPGACAAGLSFFNPRGQADRWLISPAIALPEGVGAALVFDSKSFTTDPEWLEVRVCTTQPLDRLSFLDTPLLRDTAVPTDWTTYNLGLGDYAGQTVYLAFVIRTNDGHSLLVDNVFVGTIPDNEVLLGSIHLPSYAPHNTDLTISGTLVNRGQNNLSTVELMCVVDGADTTLGTLAGLDLPYGVEAPFTTPFSIRFDEEGTHQVALTLLRPNGQPDDESDNTLETTLTVYNSTVVASRTMLVEQFTGAECGFCPQGHDRMAEALQQLGASHEWIIHHAGYYDDLLTVPASKQMTWFYNKGGQTFAPAFMSDRTRISEDNPGPVGGIGYAYLVKDLLQQAAERPCYATIEMNDIAFDEATRRITGTVSGRLGANLDAANGRITIYIIEDSIVMAQTSYTSSPSPDPNYRHMHVVRGAITGAWGDLINADAEGNYSYTINYTLPAVATLSNGSQVNLPFRTHLVAFVGHYNASDPNDCNVWNTTSCPKFQATRIGLDAPAPLSLDLYPNPATDHIILSAPCAIEQLTVSNLLGQTMLRLHDLGAEAAVSTADLPAGLYIATVRTAQGTAIQRFSVAR